MSRYDITGQNWNVHAGQDQPSELIVEHKRTSELTRQEKQGIFACFASAFSGQDISDVFDWKYVENPFGDSLHLITRAGDKIIACRSFWRLDKGPDILQCVDTAVMSEYQGRGVFRINIEYLKKNMPQLRYYNLPNEQSARQYLKYGWKTVHSHKVVLSLARLLTKKAVTISWSREELKWRFCANKTEARYFVSTDRIESKIFLWGVKRNRFPVLLGRINHLLPLERRSPLLGFSYEPRLGIPTVVRYRTLATNGAESCANYFRFDMS